MTTDNETVLLAWRPPAGGPQEAQGVAGALGRSLARRGDSDGERGGFRGPLLGRQDLGVVGRDEPGPGDCAR
jgi:hypothetical protein